MDLSRYAPAEVIAALTPRLGRERVARLDAVAGARLAGVACVLDDLRDPHNAGATLRTCDAMGVLGVHVISHRHRFRTSTRVTQGAEKWLELERWTDAAACADALHRRGYRIYSGMPGAAHRLADLDASRPLALVFGNEHTGLSPLLRDRSDGQFTIPMYGFSQSLNVSVSVAVSLHVVTEARRRRLGRSTDLDEETLLRLRARYYSLEIRGADAIIEHYRRTTP